VENSQGVRNSLLNPILEGRRFDEQVPLFHPLSGWFSVSGYRPQLAKALRKLPQAIFTCGSNI